MVLQRWYPRTHIRRTDDLSDRFWRGFGLHADNGKYVHRPLPLDVVEEDDNVVVSASLPGVSPEDVEVTVDDGVLTIKTKASEEHEDKDDDGKYLLRERRSGSYHRSVRLPDTVDADNAESSYGHGVLTVKFPKREEKKAKRIEIKVS